MTSIDVVVPTVGRGSLALLLASLDGPPDRLPGRIILVDDRPTPNAPLDTSAVSPELRERLDVVASGGNGSATARNRGWRASRAEWVAFLDDDVIPCRGWLTELAADLDGLPPDVGGSRGCLLVSAPSHRTPTDGEHDVRGVARVRSASANVAFRTSVLERVSGFDERVRRTGRDLAVRVRAAGFRIVDGRRQAVHPQWRARPRAPAGSAGDARTAPRTAALARFGLGRFFTDCQRRLHARWSRRYRSSARSWDAEGRNVHVAASVAMRGPVVDVQRDTESVPRPVSVGRRMPVEEVGSSY